MSLISTASELKQLSESTFRAEVRTTLQLAVPLGGIQLSEAAVGFINTVMMGWLDLQALAAGVLGAITFYTLTFICMGIVEGASPLAAEAFGAGKTDRIRRLLAQGLWLVVALCLPIMLLTWHLDSILMLLGQQENTVVLARTYLHAIVWGFPAAVGFFILKEVATALNRPQLISAIALTSIALNAMASYVLLFGKLGLPALGLAGIGWASAFVCWVNFIAAAAIIGFHPKFREYKLFSCLGFDQKLFAELWQNGWPLGLEYAASLLQFTVIALLMGSLGTTLLAANEIVIQTIEVSVMVPMAISFAAMTRVGQMMGHNDPTGARRAGLAAIAIAVAALSLIAVALWLFPERIAALYLDASNPANTMAIRTATPLVRISALFLIVYGLNMIAAGMLMGIQDIRLPLLVNILIYWFFGMGSGYLLGFTLNWGGIGLWSGLTLGTTLATVFLICRFYLSISKLIHSSEEAEALDKSQSTDDAQTPVLK